MNETLKLIEERHSARVPFDRERPIARGDLKQILEAARWAPTAHNMQNFAIVIVEDQELLDKIGTIQFQPSEAFLRENFQLLSFSEEELRQKKVGILGTMVPSSVRDPAQMEKGARASEPIPLHRLMPDCPALLILLYDARKRAPASEGDDEPGVRTGEHVAHGFLVGPWLADHGRLQHALRRTRGQGPFCSSQLHEDCRCCPPGLSHRDIRTLPTGTPRGGGVYPSEPLWQHGPGLTSCSSERMF